MYPPPLWILTHIEGGSGCCRWGDRAQGQGSVISMGPFPGKEPITRTGCNVGALSYSPTLRGPPRSEVGSTLNGNPGNICAQALVRKGGDYLKARLWGAWPFPACGAQLLSRLSRERVKRVHCRGLLAGFGGSRNAAPNNGDRAEHAGTPLLGLRVEASQGQAGTQSGPSRRTHYSRSRHGGTQINEACKQEWQKAHELIQCLLLMTVATDM